MKKIIFITILFISLSYGQNDYLDLNFGMTVEQVKQKGYKLKFLENDKTDNISYYKDSIVNFPIERRLFIFFENKLMVVSIQYDASNDGIEAAIVEGLKSKYDVLGKFTETENHNHYFGKINERLQIEIDYEDFSVERTVEVRFRGLKIQEQYAEFQKKKAQQNLGF